MIETFFKFKNILSKSDFSKIYLSLSIIILSSFLEIFGLFNLFVFINFITSPDDNGSISLILNFFNVFNISTELFFLLLTCSLIIFSSIFFIFGGFINNLISQKIGVSLSKRIFSIYLSQNLNIVNKIRENEVFNTLITQVQRVTNGIIYSLLNLISRFLLSFLIIGMLTYLNPFVSLVVLTIFSALYFLFYFFNKKKVKEFGLLISNLHERKIKIIRESFSNNKFIFLNQNFDILNKEFDKISSKLALIAAKNHIIPHFPKTAFEIIAIILFCIYFFIFRNTETFIEDLLVIPFYLACILKIMPLATNIYSSVISYNLNKSALDDLIKMYNSFSIKKLDIKKKLILKKSVKIYVKSFNYSKKETLFKDVILEFKRGYTYSIKGISGSGKSSLLNLITGYYLDSRCAIEIDNKKIDVKKNQFKYTSLFNYVGAESFFLDDTILNNIIFSYSDKPQFDGERIKKILQISSLNNVFKKSKINLNTVIKNNAELLSNGQKQRLALCRSLYQKSDILILDEATNSLDINSELKIIRNIRINFPNMIIINVSHRNNLDKVSDVIIQIKNKKFIQK